jgi:hypothetical protein
LQGLFADLSHGRVAFAGANGGSGRDQGVESADEANQEDDHSHQDLDHGQTCLLAETLAASTEY